MGKVWLAFLFRVSLLGWLLLESRPLLACSSCGSGAADPVMLNPAEQTKLYLGLGLQQDFREIDEQGVVRASFGPERKWLGEVALAQRLSSRIFGSVVTGFGFNQRGDRQQNGETDSSLNLRLTAIQPDLTELLLPQVQVLLSHRLATGRSIQESKKESYLDVFGAGYDETYLGADIWWGMTPVMFGTSFIQGWPTAQSTPNGRLQVGRVQRVIVSTGFLLQAALRLQVGGLAERRGNSELDGRVQANSDRQTQDLFFTVETLHAEQDNWRVTLVRKVAFGELKNASQLWGLTLAWMKNL